MCSRQQIMHWKLDCDFVCSAYLTFMCIYSVVCRADIDERDSGTCLSFASTLWITCLQDFHTGHWFCMCTLVCRSAQSSLPIPNSNSGFVKAHCATSSSYTRIQLCSEYNVLFS